MRPQFPRRHVVRRFDFGAPARGSEAVVGRRRSTSLADDASRTLAVAGRVIDSQLSIAISWEAIISRVRGPAMRGGHTTGTWRVSERVSLLAEPATMIPRSQRRAAPSTARNVLGGVAPGLHALGNRLHSAPCARDRLRRGDDAVPRDDLAAVNAERAAAGLSASSGGAIAGAAGASDVSFSMRSPQTCRPVTGWKLTRARRSRIDSPS